ncbi:MULTISPECIES: Flp family type IVb pilin [unclassified Sulfitobacter]|uniref:Flp family type IVb pilin n=1 Tax=Sulfitobacter TaxID=60136 RepID=UPI003745E03A
MMNFIKNFRKDEDGAVTVDWVVLTAAIVGLAVVAFNTIGTNTETLTGEIADAIGDVSVTEDSTDNDT